MRVYNGGTTLGNCWTVSTKTEHTHPDNPVIPLFDRYPRETYPCIHQKTFANMFTAALLIMVRHWKQPMSFNRMDE